MNQPFLGPYFEYILFESRNVRFLTDGKLVTAASCGGVHIGKHTPMHGCYGFTRWLVERVYLLSSTATLHPGNYIALIIWG